MAKNTYRIMITSLYEGDSRDSVEYYYAREGEKNIYCDAMLSAEASSKYILHAACRHTACSDTDSRSTLTS